MEKFINEEEESIDLLDLLPDICKPLEGDFPVGLDGEGDLGFGEIMDENEFEAKEIDEEEPIVLGEQEPQVEEP